MKHLLLIRHGRAETKNRDGEDSERKLIRRGREESMRMARQARKLGVKPEYVVSSPAERAVETARLFRRGLGIPRIEVNLEDDLYLEASTASLLRVVQTFPKDMGSAMVVGHNPSITEFLRFLVNDFRPVFPKSGAVWLSADAADWRSLDRGTCRVEWFDFCVSPSRMRKARLHLKTEVENSLVIAVDGVLRGIHGPAADTSASVVSKACRKITDRFMNQGDDSVLRFLRSADTPPMPGKRKGLTTAVRKGRRKGTG